MTKEISQEERAVRDADFKSRHMRFDKELKELIAKYEVTLEAEPFIFRGLMVARPSVSDAKVWDKVEDGESTVEGGDKNDGGSTVEGEDKR